MVIKAVIFSRNHGLFYMSRNLIDGDEVSSFFAELSNELAVCRPDSHRDFRLVVNNRINWRQLRVDKRKNKQGQSDSG